MGAMASMFAMIGDVAYFCTLVSAIVYQVTVVGHVNRWWVLDRFGENWSADGFCLSFKGTLYHTHLLCVYGDTAFALVLWWLSSGKPRSELFIVKDGAKSVFFHGLAHLLLWVIEEQSGSISRNLFSILSSSSVACQH